MKARFVVLTVLVALIALPNQGQTQARRQTTRPTVSRRQPSQRSQDSQVTATSRTISRRQPSQRSQDSRVTAAARMTVSRSYTYDRGYNYRYIPSRRYTYDRGYNYRYIPSRRYTYYGRGYNYGYGGYDGYYMDGYSGPLAIGGAAAATALKSSPAGVVGGVVLGWLLGQHLDNTRIQQPVENVQWYEDSNGERYWQKSGVQTRRVRPAWVDPPAKQVETNKPVEEPEGTEVP